MAKSPKDGKLLYHLTHVDNIASVLENGLQPRANLNAGDFKDTADPNIIEERKSYKDGLSHYIPFHFFVKNPYDGAVCKTEGSENMAIIAIQRPEDCFNGYYIVPNHPLSGNPDFFPYQEGFKKVRWDLIDERDYSDPEVKQACLAECDVDHPIDPQNFAFIYVKNETVGNKVRDLCKSAGFEKLAPKVQVNPYMFP